MKHKSIPVLEVHVETDPAGAVTLDVRNDIGGKISRGDSQMADRRIYAGYYRRYDGKVIYVVTMAKDADTDEDVVIRMPKMDTMIGTGPAPAPITNIRSRCAKGIGSAGPSMLCVSKRNGTLEYRGGGFPRAQE